jgi:phosphoserine phosphatase
MDDKAKRSSNILMSTRQAGPVQLSEGEFLDTALALKPAVAVFDCDGTLWSGDAGYGFMTWSLDQGLVSRNASDWIDSRYRLYRSGQVSEEAMCGEMVQIYAGLHEEEIRRASAEFFRTRVEANIFPVMRTLLKRLRFLGTDIWAVSSTNIWVIEEGLKNLQIPAERILAARVRIENDIITSKLMDVPTDEGKALALENSGIFAPDVVFGNSIHDAAMLRMAKQPFAVNPSAELVGAASTNGWPIFYPGAAIKV